MYKFLDYVIYKGQKGVIIDARVTYYVVAIEKGIDYYVKESELAMWVD